MENGKQWEYLAGVIAAVAIFICVWRIGDAFELNKSDWAAWVQAVGSIGAIWGAFWVAESQQKAASKTFRDDSLMKRSLAAQSLVTLAYRACETMKRARDHADTGGAHGTSTFNGERLDHIRTLFEKLIDPADSFTTTAALIFIDRLWEVRQIYDAVRNGVLRDHFMTLMALHIREAEKQLDRLIAHKVALDNECIAQGIVNE